MMKAIQKSSENTNTKTKTMTKTTTKTKTQKKCLKHPPYAIFLKSWWLTHSKYDDRYLTLVILFTPVTLITLVTLFQPYIQFYRAECITVSGFFLFLWTPWHQKWEHRVCIFQTMSICNGYWILHSQASGRSVWSSLHIILGVLAETRWLLGCSNLNLVLNSFWRCIREPFKNYLADFVR